jgi:hypothetical protein
VQLKKAKRGRVRRTLSAISTTLLVAAASGYDDGAVAQDFYGLDKTNNDNFGPGIAYSQLDAALLVYQEAGGRVQAIEPTGSLTLHGARGQVLSIDGVADAVSGATPNGAVPSSQAQSFVTPLRASGSTATVTSASGGSTVVQLPPTPGQIATAALGRQYTVPANTLPMDRGFHDHRAALTLGWSQPVGNITELGASGGFSTEEDYQAITASTHVSQNFNGDNTTVSLALNGEFDTSSPFGGIPTPLTAMSGQWKSPTARQKTQLGVVLGVTQILTRNWLTQLNYTYDRQKGYETDPYRVISVVDPTSGLPTATLYESRPGERQTHSVFWENKIEFGPALTDISVRYFRDDWGITSKTVEASERLNISRYWYVEPNIRWYQQTAANFYHSYLVGNQALPAYASSDARLANFHALTYGAKIGFRLSGRSEIYVRGEYYAQTGTDHPADAIGQLQQQDLFPGTKAAYGFLGYQWKFH